MAISDVLPLSLAIPEYGTRPLHILEAALDVKMLFFFYFVL